MARADGWLCAKRMLSLARSHARALFLSVSVSPRALLVGHSPATPPDRHPRRSTGDFLSPFGVAARLSVVVAWVPRGASRNTPQQQKISAARRDGRELRHPERGALARRRAARAPAARRRRRLRRAPLADRRHDRRGRHRDGVRQGQWYTYTIDPCTKSKKTTAGAPQ